MTKQNREELPVFRKTIYVLLLFVAVAILYGSFLSSPVVFDDIRFFYFKQEIAHFLGFHPFEVRWLPYFTIGWTAQESGFDVRWIRLEGLVLHAATGIALFFFLHRLFDLVLKQNGENRATLPHVWLAFFCALFFVWHPVAVYGAAYLIQRTIVMATLFSLLALYVYMRGLTEERPRWLWGSVGLYYLAIFSKEHAVMLPAVMLMLTLLLVPPSRALLRRLWPIYAACAAIALYVSLQKLGILGSVYEVAAPEMLEKIKVENPYPLSVLTQSFLFFKYWFLWLLPNPDWMSVDMREPFAMSIFSPYLLAMLAFLAYGAGGLWLLLRRGHAGLLGFAMLFPWLLFATEFATVRIQESFILYRSYLWMPGAFAALPIVLKYVRPKLAFYGMLFCAIVLATLAVNRLTTFADPFLLWDDAEKLVHNKQDLPGVARIYYNRGKYLTDMKRFPEALADDLKALKLDPEDINNHYATAVGYMNVARYADAVAEFNRTLELNPKAWRAQLGRGLSNLELGKKTVALPDLEISCKRGFKIACTKMEMLKAK